MVCGKSIFMGRRKLAESMAIAIDTRSELLAREWESEGRTVTFFGWDGELKGCLAFGDKPRPHAAALIESLQRQKITPHMISGDSRATTETIAHQLNIEDFRSEVFPEDKVKFVRAWKRGGDRGYDWRWY